MKPASQAQIQRLQNMFAAAQQAQRSGLLPQAERLYRDILKEMPTAYDVHHQLGVLLATQGNPAEATKHFRAIVKGNPTHAPSRANLANALAEAEKTAEAIAEYREALVLAPQLIHARLGLAAQLRKSNKQDEAIIEYTKILDGDRSNHAAFNGLGLAYRDNEDLPRALECFEHAVGLAPKNADYRLNFGFTLHKYTLDDLAAQQLYEAVKLRPESLDAIVLLAEVLQGQHRFDEAKECYDRTIAIKANEPELYERLGFVYLDMGDTAHALENFNIALRYNEERPGGLLGVGRCHMEYGHSAEATATFEKVLARHPDNHAAYFYLAASRKFKNDDSLIPQLKLLAEKTGDNLGAIALNFALGKIHDDLKQWDAAFGYYSKGNRLRNAEYQYDPQAEEERFAQLIQTFSQEFLAEHRHLGCDSEMPVFIVGMPRSGTTLTEQIISSHPQVIGAGEVEFWGRAPTAVPYLLKTQTAYPACISEMQTVHARQFADSYTALLRKIAGPGADPARITDKMPHNFVQLGLIALLFPKARIVHCMRDAMDNCLSIYFQNFGGEHDYAYDLANLGHHHRQYERLMQHWHSVLPGRIFEIRYEDTIADPEYWSRKLIAHVGLEWDDACLAPHKLERTVKTASHWQVRQPIYKTSVQRWKNYEQHLGPLKEALGYVETPAKP
jgi:tetratricopeptide (TPR) repeat protein